MNDRSLFRRLAGLGLAGCLVLIAACSRHDAVQVELQTRASANPEILQLQVDALVSGPMTGVHYKWFAVSGTCTPQESAQPVTQFSFAEGVANDLRRRLMRHDPGPRSRDGRPSGPRQCTGPGRRVPASC